jgi:mannose/fructose/N-acetylgalactosamine-specific phosphotransferase system component IIC
VENIIIGLFGSLIILDTTVIFQFLLSQPLITCSILGWFLGDLQLGIQVGFYLQLLWLSSIPVGGAVVPEGNVAAIVAGSMVLRYNMDYVYLNMVLVAAVLFGVMISYIGGQMVVAYRKLNIRLLNTVHHKIEGGHTSILNIIPFISIFVHFLMMCVLISLSLYLGDLIFPFIHKLPAHWDVYCRYGVIGTLGIGAGLVLTLYQENQAGKYILLGILIGAAVFYI